MSELWRGERLLIDGRLEEAAGGAVHPDVNPATGQMIGSAPPTPMRASGDPPRR